MEDKLTRNEELVIFLCQCWRKQKKFIVMFYQTILHIFKCNKKTKGSKVCTSTESLKNFISANFIVKQVEQENSFCCKHSCWRFLSCEFEAFFVPAFSHNESLFNQAKRTEIKSTPNDPGAWRSLTLNGNSGDKHCYGMLSTIIWTLLCYNVLCCIINFILIPLILSEML